MLIVPALSTLDLALADFGLRVRCNSPELCGALAARYAGFAENKPFDFEATVTVQPGTLRKHAVQDTGTFFEPDGVLRFDAPGYQGWIDAVHGRGALTVSSLEPELEVDYFLRVACALMTFERGGLMFHAAGVLRRERVFVFFGHSGSGKTTVSRLSARDQILNDDLLIFLPDRAGGWQVHSTPFWNPTQVRPAGRASARLAGLYRLVQAKQVFTRPMQGADALAEMVSNVPVICADPSRLPPLLERLQAILTVIPAFYLHFLPDDSFWQVVDVEAV
ncbi:MAG: hypothetical protein OHK0052_24330 [Anaerolineales bacterium]